MTDVCKPRRTLDSLGRKTAYRMGGPGAAIATMLMAGTVSCGSTGCVNLRQQPEANLIFPGAEGVKQTPLRPPGGGPPSPDVSYSYDVYGSPGPIEAWFEEKLSAAGWKRATYHNLGTMSVSWERSSAVFDLSIQPGVSSAPTSEAVIVIYKDPQGCPAD